MFKHVQTVFACVLRIMDIHSLSHDLIKHYQIDLNQCILNVEMSYQNVAFTLVTTVFPGRDCKALRLCNGTVRGGLYSCNRSVTFGNSVLRWQDRPATTWLKSIDINRQYYTIDTRRSKKIKEVVNWDEFGGARNIKEPVVWSQITWTRWVRFEASLRGPLWRVWTSEVELDSWAVKKVYVLL